jgi:hypothetical protein
MPLMRALHRQIFAAGTIEEGETFEASTHEARVLIALHRAVFAEKNLQVEPAVKPVAKRPYKRRDITAGQMQAK